MPTRRVFTVLFLSLLLYLFANQTQVGWLYVMSALLSGTVFAAFLINRHTLKGISGQRTLGAGEYIEYFEGDEINITLTFQNISRIAAAQIRTTEICPLADPLSEYHRLNIFIPSLPSSQVSDIQYLISIYKRGLHEFPPLMLSTGIPFGYFFRKIPLKIPSRALVYPELRPLERLDLLDRQPSVNLMRPRAGWGTEVIGVRPFRPGDSPRQIHWRSVARLSGSTQQLISKEFVDESQPGLTLALDLYPHSLPVTESKHTPFEWMVKIAASIGEYAIRRGYALHLLTDETTWPAPRGPVTRQALLEYLARVHPSGENPLANLLDSRNTQMFVAALFSYPDVRATAPLLSLKRQGLQVLAVLLDPATFPEPNASIIPFGEELSALGIDTRVISFGEDWAVQISASILPSPISHFS